MPRRFGVTARFAALATVWGASFLFIKVGLEGLSPAQVALARAGFGALGLAVVLVVRRRPLPRDPALWGHLAVVSVLLCVGPFLLFSWRSSTSRPGWPASSTRPRRC
jgi:drug/metabolite transporter (DMT)-like permease